MDNSNKERNKYFFENKKTATKKKQMSCMCVCVCVIEYNEINDEKKTE